MDKTYNYNFLHIVCVIKSRFGLQINVNSPIFSKSVIPTDMLLDMHTGQYGEKFGVFKRSITLASVFFDLYPLWLKIHFLAKFIRQS